MYFDDHAPPHFHVYYGEYAATIEIESLHLRYGRLPRRVTALVLEWAAEHREELKANWILAENHQTLKSISPLE